MVCPLCLVREGNKRNTHYLTDAIIRSCDRIEFKNLNRIIGSLKQNATNTILKVDFFKDYIQKIDIGTQVETFGENLYDNTEIIKCLASCDAIFGCVDSIDGRHLLNQISSFYLIPYFDLGVKIIADGKGGVTQICGAIHYLQPGGSSLKTRSVYTSEELRAAAMFRSNPEAYEEQKKSGYIVNVNVESPAVISINMFTSSMGVNEFLARIHPFRYDPNNEFAITRFSISDSYVQRDGDGDPDEYLKKFAGRGDMLPLLNMPDLN